MTQFARIGNYGWSYRVDGPRHAPAILLLHGFTGCAGMWDDVATDLQDSLRVVRVDLPGHGQTSAPSEAGAFGMEQVAKALAGLLTHIGIPRFHLWGYSMGGRLALFFALSYPERVDRLVLESASPGIADEADRAKRRAEDNALAGEIEQSGLAAFIARWMTQPLFAAQTHLPESRQEQARRLRMRNSETGLAASLRGMGAGVQPSLHESLPRLIAPTLILTGKHDQKFSDIGRAMENAIPDARYRALDAAGHAPHWECPVDCVSLVKPFLQASLESEADRKNTPPNAVRE